MIAKKALNDEREKSAYAGRACFRGLHRSSNFHLEATQMAKYKIRAHYYPGTDKSHALTVAENMGLLDDPEAVDWTATLVVPEVAQPQTK